MAIMIDVILEWLVGLVQRQLDELEVKLLNLLADAWMRVRYHDMQVN